MDKYKILHYKIKGSTLYFVIDGFPNVHFVPNINWELYIKKRLNTPIMCYTFDTIEETEDAVQEFEPTNYIVDYNEHMCVLKEKLEKRKNIYNPFKINVMAY